MNNQKLLKLHQRYGHLGYNNLKLLNNTDMVNGLNFDSNEPVDRKQATPWTFSQESKEYHN